MGETVRGLGGEAAVGEDAFSNPAGALLLLVAILAVAAFVIFVWYLSKQDHRG